MKILLTAIAFILLAWSYSSCSSSPSVPATFCDTCIKDSLKFTGTHPLEPHVYISARDCKPDSILWSYDGMGINRKDAVESLIGMPVSMNKDYTRCYFRDTAYAWLVFSDCYTGRCIQARLPYGKSYKLNIRRSGINNFDPKFSIADGLIAYSDKGNLFVEELTTGKTAMMTFGQEITIDYDNIHQAIDSVNITPTRIWAKVKIGDAWKELQKNVELK